MEIDIMTIKTSSLINALLAQNHCVIIKEYEIIFFIAKVVFYYLKRK